MFVFSKKILFQSLVHFYFLFDVKAIKIKLVS
jgi:hypothetical protein